MTEQNKDKIALVTGGNRGIGLETVKQLAQQGMHVLLGARNQANGSEAAKKLTSAGLDVALIHLDVDDEKTHAQAAKAIEANFGKLDVLINNAAIMLDGKSNGGFAPASKTSVKMFRKTFDTNFFSVIALTHTLLPLIKKSAAGRIVFLSSILGSLTLHSDPKSSIYNYKPPAYDISKTALNAYAVHLAYELKGTPIKVNVAHPGSVVTDMNAGGNLQVDEGRKRRWRWRPFPIAAITGSLFILAKSCPGKPHFVRII